MHANDHNTAICTESTAPVDIKVHRLLTTAEAAALLDKSKGWLDQSRGKGTGPRYLKIGANVRYRPEDIQAWLDQQVRTRVWEFDGGRDAA